MQITLNLYNTKPLSMRADKPKHPINKTEYEIQQLLEPFTTNHKAKVPPLNLMKGINPNNNDVFDTFTKIDDVTRNINFVRSQYAWNNTLLEEFEEFNVARREYEENPTQQNFNHMEEEMGDIFYTTASIAKDSGIDPKEAFKTTNRKFYNRINIMERLCKSPDINTPDSLKNCRDHERRALWNTAKRKLYDAEALQYKD